MRPINKHVADWLLSSPKVAGATLGECTLDARCQFMMAGFKLPSSTADFRRVLKTHKREFRRDADGVWRMHFKRHKPPAPIYEPVRPKRIRTQVYDKPGPTERRKMTAALDAMVLDVARTYRPGEVIAQHRRRGRVLRAAMIQFKLRAAGLCAYGPTTLAGSLRRCPELQEVSGNRAQFHIRRLFPGELKAGVRRKLIAKALAKEAKQA